LIFFHEFKSGVCSISLVVKILVYKEQWKAHDDDHEGNALDPVPNGGVAAGGHG
jgi:hypothetical protein